MKNFDKLLGYGLPAIALALVFAPIPGNLAMAFILLIVNCVFLYWRQAK